MGLIELSGQRFGSWTVLQAGERHHPNGGAYWLCRCDCGTAREVYGHSLRSGKSVCCGKCHPRDELAYIYRAAVSPAAACKPRSARRYGDRGAQ